MNQLTGHFCLLRLIILHIVTLMNVLAESYSVTIDFKALGVKWVFRWQIYRCQSTISVKTEFSTK